MDQILCRHMVSSSTIRVCWSTLVFPESAWLTSHSPEYWVHHRGREKALSAALQLQHDAGLILSNVQVLQQLVTALNRISSDVLRAVHGRRPLPANAMQQVMPSYRVRRWRCVCGVCQSRRRSEDPCRWRRAMPACPAVIASRMCLCEPGGEVEIDETVIEQYFHIPCSLVC